METDEYEEEEEYQDEVKDDIISAIVKQGNENYISVMEPLIKNQI